MKEQPTSKDDNELIQRVCRGVASIQEGERLRAYIAGLQSALERSQHQITMLLGARAPVETTAVEPSFAGLKLVTVVDGSVPPDTIEFRASDGRVLGRIRQLAIASVKATAPTWEDLRGIAPDATGTLSSEEFVRETRNAWDQK